MMASNSTTYIRYFVLTCKVSPSRLLTVFTDFTKLDRLNLAAAGEESEEDRRVKIAGGAPSSPELSPPVIRKCG
jgi:hypothetical protein